jgi:ankyrin repeat protein
MMGALVVLFVTVTLPGESVPVLQFEIHEDAPLEKIKALVDAGAEVNFPVPKPMSAMGRVGPFHGGEVPLDIACARKDAEGLKIIEYLLQRGADPNRMRNLSTLIVEHPHPESFMELLVRHGLNIDRSVGEGGWTLLHHAASEQKKDAVALLLKLNANPNLQTLEKKTPMHVLLATTEIPEIPDRSASLKLLLARNANPDVQDHSGDSALHTLLRGRRSASGIHRAMEILLEAGANSRLRNNENLTPLEMMVKMDWMNSSEPSETSILLAAYGGCSIDPKRTFATKDGNPWDPSILVREEQGTKVDFKAYVRQLRQKAKDYQSEHPEKFSKDTTSKPTTMSPSLSPSEYRLFWAQRYIEEHRLPMATKYLEQVLREENAPVVISQANTLMKKAEGKTAK